MNLDDLTVGLADIAEQLTALAPRHVGAITADNEPLLDLLQRVSSLQDGLGHLERLLENGSVNTEVLGEVAAAARSRQPDKAKLAAIREALSNAGDY